MDTMSIQTTFDREKFTKQIWKHMGNEGEPPAIPEASDLQGELDQTFIDAILNEAKVESIQLVGTLATFNKYNDDEIFTSAEVLDIIIARRQLIRKKASDEELEIIHRGHKELKARGYSIKHPLAALFREWLLENILTVQPERRKDTGIIHHALRDTYPSPRLPMTVEDLDTPIEQLELISNLPQGDLQLEMPGFEFPESEIVPALPLVAYEAAGGATKSPGRGAPIQQRLFFNILVEYEQKQRGVYGTSRLSSTWGDVKSWLYPNGTKEPRKTLIPKIYRGLYRLHNDMKFIWERREWNIIAVDAFPTMNIRPDDELPFTIRMPPGMNTQNGALIGIEPLRLYGAQSAPKFRAWIRLAYLWDAAKIRNGGKRIYATIPEVLRNEQDYLVDAKDEVILTGDLYRSKHKRGWAYRQGNQPQKAWYHPLAIRTGQEIRNPQADKVPVLSDADMVKLFYDHTERRGDAFRNALKDARKNALEMQKDGRVVVETNQINDKTGQRGWRILEPHRRGISLRYKIAEV